MAPYPEANRLDRMEALRLYTAGSAWFSGEEEKKGAILPGRLADLAVLSDDYFSVRTVAFAPTAAAGVSGGSHLQPQSILQGRLLRLGAVINW